jgi:DNA gyrase subunit A
MTSFAKETLPISLEEEMRHSYLDYAMSVIVGRALPDVRDGLKPVHRRVLFAMHELSNDWNKAYKKSARIVGDVIGKYHPHGDTAVYDTIVRMAQNFSLRYMLVDGQGNFGSVDGDNAAAMRYTEVRMARIGHELLIDIDKETVDFGPNYDGSEQEPLILPARIPNLLINGSSGIAVGMATNIPPHNLNEVVDACLVLLGNPEATIEELIAIIPAPDFPTAGLIYGVSGVRDGYLTGRGRVVMRARTHIEDLPRSGRQAIVVDELPYQVNKKTLQEKIAELVNEKKIDGIAHIQDESDKSGMRLVIELKKGQVPEVVLNHLYKQTQLQDTFGMNMVALVDGRPRLLNLKDMLQCFLAHRREVITRRTVFELRKARERGHILEGLAVALSNVDEIIALIKAAQTPAEAKRGLMARTWRSTLVEGMLARASAESSRPDGLGAEFGLSAQGYLLSDAQAQAILELRLQRLTGLEQDKIVAEYKEVMEQIADLLDILARPERITTIIGEELTAVKAQFGDARRSEIVLSTADINLEDLIVREDMVVTLSHTGYIKRQPLADYRAQRRGGRGKQAAAIKEGRFRRSPVRRQYPRLHPVLLQPWPRLLAQGLRGAGRPARLARQADRQPIPARGRREDHRDPAGQGIRRRALRLHGHRHGHREEDPADQFCQSAQGRHHRRRPRRGRPPDRRRHHQRRMRRDAVLGCRQGCALRRGRRAADGPRSARRARHDAGGRAGGHLDAGG